MPCLLYVDFPYTGPWGKAMSDAMHELAMSIADEPGLLWKIWTENPATQQAGGVYLFTDSDSAQRYLDMHTRRLTDFGITGIVSKLFTVNEPLSRVDRAPLPPSA